MTILFIKVHVLLYKTVRADCNNAFVKVMERFYMRTALFLSPELFNHTPQSSELGITPRSAYLFFPNVVLTSHVLLYCLVVLRLISRPYGLNQGFYLNLMTLIL